MRRRDFLSLMLCTPAIAVGCGGPKRDVKYRIAVIPKGLTHEFWQSIHRGAQRAAVELKGRQNLEIEVRWDGPMKENETQEQISIIDRNLSAHKVHGVALAPQHSANLIPSVEKAVAQGVPVLVFDSGLAPEGQKHQVKYIATDNYNGGKLAAEHLVKVLREEGKPAPKIVLLRYQIGSESTEQRERGFEDYINKVIAEQTKAGQPTIQWLSRDKYAGATQDTALKEATPLLNNLRNQGIDGIFAPNESSASGVLAAMRSLQLNKKVKLMGFDSSAPLVDAVREGDVDGLILQDPYRMGFLSVWTLVQHLEGFDVTPNGQRVQSTGENVVTKSNIDTTAVRELFEPDLQAKRTFDPPTFSKR